MKKSNLHLMFQWVLFMPIIIPICILFGALQGIANATEQAFKTFWADVSTSEKTLT